MHQVQTAECGLICLAIAAKRLGATFDLSSLRQKFYVSSRGMTMREVKEVAAEMGMVGRAISCEIDELSDLKTPAILHWELSHFVVLEQVRKGLVYIHDPVRGRSRSTLKEISPKFTGVALELSTSPSFVRRKERSPLSIFTWFRMLPGILLSLAHIFFLSLVLQLFAILAPLYLQLSIDKAASKGDSGLLMSLAFGFGLLCVFNVLANVLRGIAASRLTALVSWDITLRLFRHMIRLPLPWFQQRRLADILSRFDAIAPIRDLLTGALVAILLDGILAVCTLGMMIIFSPKLALIVLGGFLIFVIIRLCALPASVALGVKAISARIAENGKRIETVRSIQTIKVMGAESDRENDWANCFSEAVKNEQINFLANLSFNSLQLLVEGLVRVSLIYFGALAIMEGGMSVGLFYAFLMYQGQFTSKASALFEQLVNLRMTDIFSHRLADIVLSKKEENIDAIPAGQPDIVGAIEFRNLGFTYGPRLPFVFSGMNLRIPAGEFVAIVGASGAGKSTLLKVVCGLYPPTHGDVFLDGHPLSWWGAKSLRRALGVVSQDDELLVGTIAENVAFFSESIEMERVWFCLSQAAVIDDVRNMPMRAETMIGDMATNLSGGQKQRLLIARALYRGPRLLLLDEATSHLDFAREYTINKALAGLKVTRLVVAHRKETIEAADRVIRLEHGRIVSDTLRDRD